MKTILEAAQSLLSKNKITKNEFDFIEKQAANIPMAPLAKNIGGFKMILKRLLDIPDTYSKVVSTNMLGKPIYGTVSNQTEIAALTARDIFKGLNKLVFPIAATTAGGVALKELVYDPMKQKSDIEKSYSKILETTPALAGADQQKVRDYFDVVKSYSPHAAANPVVAGAIVNKIYQFGGVDHKLVQDLASLQETQNKEGIIPMLLGGAAKALSGSPKDSK